MVGRSPDFDKSTSILMPRAIVCERLSFACHHSIALYPLYASTP